MLKIVLIFLQLKLSTQYSKMIALYFGIFTVYLLIGSIDIALILPPHLSLYFFRNDSDWY